MDKKTVIASLRASLAEVGRLRAGYRPGNPDSAARVAVKQFQAARMMKTHADLLAGAATQQAAVFFLEDLYGAHDVSRRDADLERILPAMEKLLPLRALDTVAQAMVLDALSETLDAAMALELGPQFTEADYLAAYAIVGSRETRERQLALVQGVGRSLGEVVRIPLIGATLKMMRKPAQAAKLGELQQFLERGFTAFRSLKKPEDFVATIIAREREILRRSYAGEAAPFAGP